MMVFGDLNILYVNFNIIGKVDSCFRGRKSRLALAGENRNPTDRRDIILGTYLRRIRKWKVYLN